MPIKYLINYILLLVFFTLVNNTYAQVRTKVFYDEVPSRFKPVLKTISKTTGIEPPFGFYDFKRNNPSQQGFSQTHKDKGMIGITIPVIYNQSYGVYYQTGNRKTPEGGAISYGLDICYKHPVYKSIFVKAAVGVFKQNFKIERPLHFWDSLRLGYFTQTYAYENLTWLLGVEIRKSTCKNATVIVSLNYVGYSTFCQKYVINKDYKTREINKNWFNIGNMLTTEIGANRKINRQISVESNLIFSVIANWNKDPIFINTNYSTDQTIIAKNKFSGGLSFSAYYHF